MWVVADLDDDYIAKMEDVLELYERPYDPQQAVVCLDEKPVTLHADVRPSSLVAPGRDCEMRSIRQNRSRASGILSTYSPPDSFDSIKPAIALRGEIPGAGR